MKSACLWLFQPAPLSARAQNLLKDSAALRSGCSNQHSYRAGKGGCVRNRVHSKAQHCSQPPRAWEL